MKLKLYIMSMLLIGAHQTMHGAAAADAEPIPAKTEDAARKTIQTKTHAEPVTIQTMTESLLRDFEANLSKTNPCFYMQSFLKYKNVIVGSGLTLQQKFSLIESLNTYFSQQMAQLDYKKNLYSTNFFELGLFHQKFFLPKLGFFLFEELEKSKTINSTEILIRKLIIAKLFSSGACGGFATLFIFAQLTTNRLVEKTLQSYIETQKYTLEEIEQNKKKYIQEALAEIAQLDCFTKTSDYTTFWFNKIRELVLAWDTETSFTEEEKYQVERFVEFLLLFQSISEQSFNQDKEYIQFDLPFTLHTADDRAPKLEFEFLKQDKVSKDSLIDILKKWIQPGLMILFKSNMSPILKEYDFHILGIYQDTLTGKISLFDAASNNPNPYEFDDSAIELLVNTIFVECFKETSNDLKNVILKVFSLEKNIDYPDLKSLQFFSIRQGFSKFSIEQIIKAQANAD